MTQARRTELYHVAGRALATMMLGVAMLTVPALAGAMQSTAGLTAAQPEATEAARAWGLGQVLVWRTDVVLTVVVAMVEAILFAIPIAHAYRLAKHRHEYDPAVTETMLILPAVVAGEHGETIEYRVRLKKKTDPRTLLDSLNAAAQAYGATVEYHPYSDGQVGPAEGR